MADTELNLSEAPVSMGKRRRLSSYQHATNQYNR